MRIVGRELYPTTAFATTPAELDVKYLPSASAFYQVKDAETEEEIIPFGTGSKISCDSTGNYFNLRSCNAFSLSMVCPGGFKNYVNH